MNMYDILLKKREGEELSAEEISFFVQGFSRGEIPDYQASAFLMAAFLKGLSSKETVELTQQMLLSGDSLDLSEIEGFKLDKHSTGGVGDKTSLVLAPLLASAGVIVPKLSGRGLGHTGGTIDKLESIPGFQTDLPMERFLEQLQKIGFGILGASANLAPADKALYALRDVTATVEHPSLIASSIMSKKLAAGADGILLDVKFGEGAFMKTPEEALLLSKMLVEIGEKSGKKTRALISSMEAPLGKAVGNSLEVREAMDALKGEGPTDLQELCLTLATQGLLMSGQMSEEEKARHLLVEKIRSGAAFEKFLQFVREQGGDLDAMPKEKEAAVFRAPQSGVVRRIHALPVARAALSCGAGRRKKTDAIDPGAGILLHVQEGDRVETGDILAGIYTRREEAVSEAQALLKDSFVIDDTVALPSPMIYGTVYYEKGESVFSPMKGKING